jgi:hypothetical protein
MPELTDEEKRILELMRQLEASDPVVPHQAHNQDFLPGIDDQGNPIPLSGPLPSAEQQAADARELIRALEAQVAAREAAGKPTSNITTPGTPAPDPTRRRR